MKVMFPITEREYLRFAGKIKEHQEKGRGEDEPISSSSSPTVARIRIEAGSASPTARSTGRPGTILVQALFPNPDGILRPGLYAKVRAATETVRGALLVPERAVQEIQGTYQVAVVGADDRIALRTVKMGQQLDGLWIVTKVSHPASASSRRAYRRSRTVSRSPPRRTRRLDGVRGAGQG
jgi:membrane fusion protein (multidrug efflux system)